MTADDVMRQNYPYWEVRRREGTAQRKLKRQRNLCEQPEVLATFDIRVAERFGELERT